MPDTRKPVVYLSGPIHGLPDSDCRDWREEAKTRLAPWFTVLDPLRHDWRGRESEEAVRRAIIKADMADVHEADYLLVNAAAPGWGTAMELMMAVECGATTVTFGAPDNPSPWLVHYTNYAVDTLEEACDFLVGCADPAKWQ
jgi:nucleoside 2-deoxyribosyltransferase